MADKTSAVDYQKSLLKSLAKLCIRSSSELTDFVVKCPDTDSPDQKKIELPTYKLLLVGRSKYFEALIRQEPKTTQAHLDYEASDVKIILENLIEISEDLTKLEIDQVLRLLEITDFLQMESLTKVFEKQISDQLTKENIHDIANSTENFHVPNLNAKCCIFVKEHITDLDLKAFSKTWLKQLTSSPMVYAKDKYGHLLALNESETLFVIALEKVDSKEDWNVSLLTRRRIHMFLSRMADDSITEEYKNVLQKYPLPKGEENLESFENYPDLLLGNHQIYSSDVTYGKATNVRDFSRELSVRGNFRKIGVKTRLWDNRLIIQGLKIELENGDIKTLGMDVSDTRNVTELVVPQGQHIKDVFLKSGWYIDEISFETNEGVVLGPVGGQGGGPRLQITPRRLLAGSLAYYLDEISCKVVHTDTSTFETENDAQPCIALVRFSYVGIPLIPKPFKTLSETLYHSDSSEISGDW